MPYKARKLRGGKVAVTNTATGKQVVYESEEKAEVGMRMREAIKHGFKPTGAKGTGRIARGAAKTTVRGRSR